MIEWIKTTDKLPADNREVLVCSTIGEILLGGYIAERKGWGVDEGCFATNITHWAEINLPEGVEVPDWIRGPM